jgi:hypothetical protein
MSNKITKHAVGSGYRHARATAGADQSRRTARGQKKLSGSLGGKEERPLRLPGFTKMKSAACCKPRACRASNRWCHPPSVEWLVSWVEAPERPQVILDDGFGDAHNDAKPSEK